MKIFKKVWFWIGLVLLAFLICIWPIRWAFSPGFLTQTHLVLLTNEAEARPCGGFVTAVGTVRIFPPKITLTNAYAFADKNFGIAQPPLDQVAPAMKFWDLGISPDCEECQQAFHNAANIMGLKHDHLILVSNKIAEKIIDDPDFFAEMTRTVANTDRHDETALAERKTPLADFGKQLIVKTLLQPWKWFHLCYHIRDAIKTGELYISDISPALKPLPNDIAAIEWNLGGGKSSRFLKRNLDISTRETAPGIWNIKVKVSLEHLGQQDEPLSQTWKGGIEMRWPDKWNAPDEFLSVTLEPGETWCNKWVFEATENLENIDLFAARGQEWNVDFRLSLFGQKTFKNASFETSENMGTWQDPIRTERKSLHWKTNEDTIKPFVTLHEWLSLKQIPEEARDYWSDNFAVSSRRFGVAEIHFSEPIFVTKKLHVTFRDKDFENSEITDDPWFYELLLWSGNQTVLLGFWQDKVQPNERFGITLQGLQDIFGNEIDDQEYTIIDRNH